MKLEKANVEKKEVLAAEETVKQEEVIEEGFTKKNINAWKAEWGKIYKSIIDGETYIWRKLRRKEYVDFMTEIEKEGEDPVYTKQDKITKTVVIFPNNIEELIETNCGLSTSISDEVLLKSGFYILSTEEL
jgi:hypothetical protein